MDFIEKHKRTLEGVAAGTTAALATLNKSRRDILDALPGKRDASTDDKIMEGIASAHAFIGAFGSALAPLYPTGHALTPKQRREHFRQLAATLDRSRELLDQTLKHADTDPEFLMELMNDDVVTYLGKMAHEKGQHVKRAANEFGDGPDFVEPIKRARDAIAQVATLATAAAERVPVRRGAPDGDHVVNPNLYRALAHIYTEATGREPVSGDGSFVKFANSVVSALGIELPPNYDVREPAMDALSGGQHAARREARRRERRARHR